MFWYALRYLLQSIDEKAEGEKKPNSTNLLPYFNYRHLLDDLWDK